MQQILLIPENYLNPNGRAMYWFPDLMLHSNISIPLFNSVCLYFQLTKDSTTTKECDSVYLYFHFTRNSITTREVDSVYLYVQLNDTALTKILIYK